MVLVIETPLRTLDALAEAIKVAVPRDGSGNKFVSIDSRVLEWLIADSRTLHAQHAAMPAPK